MANTIQRVLSQKIMPFARTLMGSKDLSIVLFIIVIMAIIIVPLPSHVLDFLLSISLALSVLIILMALYIDKPTEFSAFPTILLIVTLYRLALNVATTRMILAEGYNGADNVSSIINAFGRFVAEGNYVIGIIVFSILVIVNLIVITNGATRVTEVRARFTLDAMPGKQMAIDADLNAGLINQEEARARRESLQQEADFYGTMDGASKFVKGDAIAAIIITLVNIIGGFLIGVFEYNLSIAQSAQTFTILTIGDGLVGQIPALIIATATGIITTRAAKSSETSFANDIVTQIIGNSKILLIVGFILCMFALVPGLPISLGFVGVFFFLIAWLGSREDSKSFFHIIESWLNKYLNFKIPESTQPTATPEDIERHKKQKEQKSEEEIREQEEAMLNEALKVEVLEIHLGYSLIKLVDVRQNGDLLERIRSMRKKVASDYGFLIPQVRIKDNLNLDPNAYNIILKSVVIGSGNVMSDKMLAMDTGMVVDKESIEGIPTKEPVFGMDALWIDMSQKDEAAIQGYTIIDPANVITTHLTELIKEYAEEFITIDEVKTLMNKLSNKYPTIVSEAQNISLSTIKKVLQSLLREGIPIRDMITILESLVDVYPVLQNDIDSLVEQVRARLSRTITDLYKSDDNILKAMILSARLEQFLFGKLKERALLLNADESETLSTAIASEAQKLSERGIVPVVLLVDYRLRKGVANLTEQYRHKIQSLSNVVVLSNAEIDTHIKYELLSEIDVTL
ncbi:flagellar biosynthesis protein FlhA [uncultured Helicobacter sp.]|uniref:flagellar biosynthesis protein FlhA n=1 Tax=uncultured Helicobacter sp. TaxID=175537 RepID=UPI00374F333C